MDEIKELVYFLIEEHTIKEEFDGEPTIDKEALTEAIAEMVQRRENAIYRKHKISKDKR